MEPFLYGIPLLLPCLHVMVPSVKSNTMAKNKAEIWQVMGENGKLKLGGRVGEKIYRVRMVLITVRKALFYLVAVRDSGNNS